MPPNDYNCVGFVYFKHTKNLLTAYGIKVVHSLQQNFSGSQKASYSFPVVVLQGIKVFIESHLIVVESTRSSYTNT